ncbi:MAG: proteasome assembly chaperone family protein [Leucobacter sp.]
MTNSAETYTHPRVLIAAFEGWSDAGAATTTVLQHLGDLIGAEVLHSIGSDGYIDFQVHRPKLYFDENDNRVLDWPDSRLYGPIQRPGASDPVQGDTVRRLDGTPVSDLYLLAGVEPARDWQSFADEVVDLVDVWSIDRVIMLGSMFSDAPHSRPIVTSVSSESAEHQADAGAVRSTYEGPVGIGTIVELALVDAGVAPVSLWAQVPHYVHSSPSPKATLALLDKLEELLDVVIPRGSLLSEANEWEENINRIASADEEMTQYIRRLEESRDEEMAAGTTGDALAAEFEKFLEQPPAGSHSGTEPGAAQPESGTGDSESGSGEEHDRDGRGEQDS